MRNLTLIIALLIISSNLLELKAQTTEIDSLENLLQQYQKKDTIRVNLLNETADKLNSLNVDKTFKYAKEAGELSDKLSFTKGKVESLLLIGIYYCQKSDYPKALGYYKKSLKLNEELGDKRGISKCYNNIGNIYSDQDDYPKALGYYQKSLKIDEELGDKRGISKRYYNIGNIYSDQDDYAKALEYYQKSLKIDEELGDKNGISNSYINIGIIYKKQGDYPKALDYCQKSLKIKEELGDKSRISKCYNNIGIIYKYQGDYPKALEYYQKSLKIKEELGDKRGISSSYNNIGIIYKKQGDYPKALGYYQKSLKIDEELGDKSEISKCYNNIGIIYYYQGDYPKALEYYQKSLKIKEELGNKNGISNSYINIGIIYKKQGDYPKALGYSQKSLKIKEELGDKNGISHCYNNIGNIYYYQGDYPKALEYYQKSLKISIEIGAKFLETKNNKELGSLYLKQKKIKEAYNYSKKAYTLAEEIGEVDLLKESSEVLAKSSEALGLYKEAFKYYVIFKTMNDSLYNEENVKKITSLEYQYKYEKEKQATELEQQKKDAVKAEEAKRQKTVRNSFIAGFVLVLILGLVVLRSFLHKRKANRILAEQKEEIETQSEELKTTNEKLIELDHFKDGLTGMIVHDLKNPLTAILNLSKDLEVKQAGKSMLNMVLDIMEVQKFENAEMKLQQSNVLLNKIIKTALNQVNYLAHQKSITIETISSNNFAVNIDFEIITRVIVNLLTNAIKYTPNNGRITIIIAEKESTDFMEVRISDSGPGISKNMLNKVFDRFSQLEARDSGSVRSTGLGLTFCKLAVEAHGGQIGVESDRENKLYNLHSKQAGSNAGGSTFWFYLPISQTDEIEQIEIAEEEIKTISQKDIDPNLSETDIKFLKPYLSQLKKLTIHEYSDIKVILNKINIEETNLDLSEWKKQIENALRMCNEEKYNELIHKNLKL